MKFRKYNSIDNATEKNLNDIMTRRGRKFNCCWEHFSNDFQFAVTEKIHGANYALYCDGTDFKVASRTRFLTEDANFFNHQIVINRYKDAAFKCYNEIKKTFETHSFYNEPESNFYIIVYGELFGGNFTIDKELKKEYSNVKAVQGDVSYIPDIDFRCFDIFAVCTDERFLPPENDITFIDNDFPGRYLNYYTMKNVCKKSGIPYVKVLFTGTLKECLEYPNEYNSKIPEEILGRKYDSENICEGNVIKQTDVDIYNYSFPSMPPLFDYQNRIVLKHKNSKFSEKSQKPEKVVTPLPEEVKRVCEIAFTLITDNRLNNLISKGIFNGDWDEPKNFGKLIGEFSKDVMDDLNKEIEIEKELPEKSDRKRLNKCINQEISKFLKPKVFSI
jgi:Rnl2 family RNA ligase